ncbi:hypothetical protein [Corynebacterium hindlerae]|uniref:hypothetical protein n=1 Tax=Corynebacterium hindlerae TaxID=699041 RepID=UPI0031B6EA16
MHTYQVNQSDRFEVIIVGDEFCAETVSLVQSDQFWVALIPEPDHPEDSHAVSVRFRGQCIGYLSAYRAHQYLPEILAIIASGRVPFVRAAMTKLSPTSQDIYLALPQPGLLLRGDIPPAHPGFRPPPMFGRPLMA